MNRIQWFFKWLFEFWGLICVFFLLWCVCYHENGLLSVDDEYITFEPLTELHALTPNTLQLFWSTWEHAAYFRIKRFKISENGVLIKDFVPVYDNVSDVCGMFDTVSQRFFANRGAGNFICGPNSQVSISCSEISNGNFAVCPPGAQDIADCGRLLHAGIYTVYLRNQKRTTPSLVVRIGDTLLYGDMVPGISRGHLCVKYAGQDYSVCNTDVDK